MRPYPQPSDGQCPYHQWDTTCPWKTCLERRINDALTNIYDGCRYLTPGEERWVLEYRLERLW